MASSVCRQWNICRILEVEQTLRRHWIYYVELCSRRQPEIVRPLLMWPCWSPTASRRSTGTACRRRRPLAVTQASRWSSLPLIGRWWTRSSWGLSSVRRHETTISPQRPSALFPTSPNPSSQQCCCVQVFHTNRCRYYTNSCNVVLLSVGKRDF